MCRATFATLKKEVDPEIVLGAVFTICQNEGLKTSAVHVVAASLLDLKFRMEAQCFRLRLCIKQTLLSE